MSSVTRILPDPLKELIRSLFLKQGVAEKEADFIAEHLVTSNLMGHDSHGVIRAPWYLEKIQKGEIVLGAPIEIEKETASSAIVNGHWGFGQTIAKFAMDLAIKKAETQILSCVTVHQCNHVGRLGAYTSAASSVGMVGIGMANLHGTSHCVAPYGGKDARLPTNPISIAFPRRTIPDFLLDMTTSVVAEGKVRLQQARGKPLPEGWVIDAEGHPSIDPSRFYDAPRGSLLPLGGAVGYKGYALSLAVDALSGALSRASCSNPQSRRHGNACLFIALRIDAFAPLEEFQSKVDGLVDHVKSSRHMEGVESILIPGEPEYLSMQKKKREGIVLDQTTWENLCQKAREGGLAASVVSYHHD